MVILLRRSPTKGPVRVGKDKGSSAKRSNFAASPTFNICFTNSQEFNSPVANSAELDGVTSKGNNESTTVRNISNERLNVINDNASANSTERLNEVINNSSSETSNEVNDFSVNESNESSGGCNEVNAINLNVAVVENVAEIESVDVMAGAGAATSGRPFIEVIDEGQFDHSSDGIESFEDSFSSSSLTPIFSDPPPDFADAMDESDRPSPRIRPLLLLFPLLLLKLGLAMRGVAFALKPKVRVGLIVFVSPRFLSLCLASTFWRKLLLANQKGLVFAVVLPLRSLICSSPPRPPSLAVLRFSSVLSWLCLSVRVSLLAAPLVYNPFILYIVFM